jgi:membrane protease YdiL (CAAX protease family)
MFDHRSFMRFAGMFEAALALLAVLIGWLVGIVPSLIVPSLESVLIGIAATLPLILVYFVTAAIPLDAFQRIQNLLIATLGRPLAECRWHEVALLALLAGVCEELLFRGVIQPWLSRVGEPTGVVGTSLLFGLAHSVTPTYFLLASGIGFYLSGVQAAAGHIAAPMLTHALYDWFAFRQIARLYRQRKAAGDLPPSPFEFGPDEGE